MVATVGIRRPGAVNGPASEWSCTTSASRSASSRAAAAAWSSSGTGSPNRSDGGSRYVRRKSAGVASRPAPTRVTRCPRAISAWVSPATTSSMPPYASGGTLNQGGATIAMCMAPGTHNRAAPTRSAPVTALPAGCPAPRGPPIRTCPRTGRRSATEQGGHPDQRPDEIRDAGRVDQPARVERQQVGALQDPCRYPPGQVLGGERRTDQLPGRGRVAGGDLELPVERLVPDRRLPLAEDGPAQLGQPVPGRHPD